MARTIGIIAIKGGVGKTTVASSLAADLVNHYGKKVLLVDANFSAPNLGAHMDLLDHQKSIHDVLAGKARAVSAVHSRFGVDVIPGDTFFRGNVSPLKLRDRLSAIKEGYDFVILDASPSLNDELLSTILASDHLFVVTTPDYPTMNCSIKAAQLARQRGKPVAGIIINKIRDPSYELSLKEVEDCLDIPVVARIPDDKHAIRALFTRIPLSVYKRHSAFSKEITRLGAAITGEKERRSWFRNLVAGGVKREEVNRQLLKESFYKSLFSD